jgi:hypothetical protein
MKVLKPLQKNIIKIPDNMVCNNLGELCQRFYNNFGHNYQNSTYLQERAIMCSANKTAQEGNNFMTNQLPGEMHKMDSIDKCIEEQDQAVYDAEFLNHIDQSGLPPHHLHLKKNMAILLICNMRVP